MTPLRLLALAGLLTLLAIAGWRNVGQLQAERYASDDPAHALQWRPHDPLALQAVAERQLKAGDTQAAQATARHLLAREPLHGVAFRLLAEAAERGGDDQRALALYKIAARRAPRDLPTRVWLAQHHLEQGDFKASIEQIDRILRLSPDRAPAIEVALVQLSQDPEFATALAARLRRDPPWRFGVLGALNHPTSGNPKAAGQVMQALLDQGGLSPGESAAWLDSLMAQDRWGEAYARWAASATKPGGALPLVYNGDFETPSADSGFDWRLRRVPGVLLAFEPASGTQGQAAHLTFLGRRISAAGLEQPLLLSPGTYVLKLRQRAQGLRSGVGLQWQLSCVGKGGLVARSEPVDGSFAWRAQEMSVTIPQEGCAGQWLRLVNPVAGGAAQQVSGELWLDDVTLTPQGLTASGN